MSIKKLIKDIIHFLVLWGFALLLVMGIQNNPESEEAFYFFSFFIAWLIYAAYHSGKSQWKLPK